MLKKGVIAAAAAFALAATPAHAGLELPLGHKGRWLTDARGRVTILHGFNMVYKRPPYAPDAIGFGADDAEFLESEGYDTVRVGVIYKAVEPQPGVYDDAYLERIAKTVDLLQQHGIVSLLDFHQDLYNERFQGEGWPDWAVMDDGLPNRPQAGFPGNYLTMPALQRAFDHFWNNDGGLQDRYAAAWAHVAARFKDVPGVLGYDLMNEPWPGSTWQQCANTQGCPAFDATMAKFIARTIKAIRGVDPGTLAFYEPQVLFNDGADTNLPDTGDAHAAMSFHDYCLTAGSGGCDALDDRVFANADKHASATGDALLLTEFGATGDPNVLTPMADRADRFMVGWQEWHYCGCDDPTTSGPGDEQAIVRDPRKPPQGDNVDESKLKLLTRPYPRAVAGTPTGFGFADRIFTLTFVSRGTAGETEVVVPRRQYPFGYAAAVTGGRIVSAPDAPVLRLVACADRVRVTVEPSGPTQDTCAAAQRAATPRLRLRVAPASVRAGRRTTVRATVTAAGHAVRGAVVRLAGARAMTDRRGHARLRKRFVHRGRRTAKATARGFLTARRGVRVR